MVLEFLDKNLYDASCEQQLERQDVKRAVKAALEGLAVLHANKRAHTGQFHVTALADSFTFRLMEPDLQTSNLITSLLTMASESLGLATLNLATLGMRFQKMFLQTLDNT